MDAIDSHTRSEIVELIRRYKATDDEVEKRRIGAKIVVIIRHTIVAYYRGDIDDDLPEDYPGMEDPLNIIEVVMENISSEGTWTGGDVEYLTIPDKKSPGRKSWIFYKVVMPTMPKGNSMFPSLLSMVSQPPKPPRPPNRPRPPT
jgi:hypothetical protein